MREVVRYRLFPPPLPQDVRMREEERGKEVQTHWVGRYCEEIVYLLKGKL
jgi:hypothetical protein